MPHTVSDAARQRLREAQRAEATALSAVAAATTARERLTPRIAAADRRIDQAVVDLVAVSGVERTAQLLDEPLTAIRGRLRRASHAKPGDPHSQA